MDTRKDFTGAKVKAHITLTLNEDGKCGINWKGDTVHLSDILYTTMLHDSHMAALICQTAKDYIETCKGDPQQWQQLTVECSDIQKEMARRYVRHPLINDKTHGKPAHGEEQQEA